MNCRTCYGTGILEAEGFKRLACEVCEGLGRVLDFEAERAEKQRFYKLTRRNNFSKENLQKRRGYK